MIRILILLLVLSLCKNSFAQYNPDEDFGNYSLSSPSNQMYKNLYENYNQNIPSKIQADNQKNYYQNQNNFQKNTPVKSREFEYNYQQNFNQKPLNSINNSQHHFKDGLGEGYRVYDYSNRQSYFCGLNGEKKSIFTHQNNFNGVYVGVGVNLVNSGLAISEKGVNRSTSSATLAKSYNYNVSSNSIVPSIIIGQGRLFSNGLYLGQEMSILVGDFTLDKKNLKPSPNSENPDNKIDSVKFRASNLSFYSGKFGFNIFDVILPYLKAGLSFSSTNYQLNFKDKTSQNSSGNWPFLAFGGGIDFSLRENFRFMIDYTMLTTSSEVNYNEYSPTKLENSYNIPIDLTASFLRANLVYRF